MGAESTADLLLGGNGTLYGNAAAAGPVIDGRECVNGTVSGAAWASQTPDAATH